MASAALDLPAAGPCAPHADTLARTDGLHLVPWHAAREPAFLAAWSALAAEACEPNPFYAPWALLPALEVFDPRGKVSLACFHAEGELRGLLPVAPSRSYYGRPVPHLAGWLHDNAFCGAPLVRRGSETAFWHALFSQPLAESGSALFLHLAHIPQRSPLTAALHAVLAVNGRVAAEVHREDRALLCSELDAETYFEAAMSGKKRKELRRQHRRLAEEGRLEFVRQEDGAGLGGWIDEFLALELAGWKGKAGSALACDARTERFFRDSLKGAAAAGALERLALRFDGRPIAMLANFLTPPGAFSFKTTFDEHFARFSPGVLLQRENLALLARPDVRWADSCAAADHPMIERIWREKRTMLRLSIGLGGTLRQAAFRQLLRLERNARIIGS